MALDTAGAVGPAWQLTPVSTIRLSDSSRSFWRLFWATFAVKLLLAAVLPFTGDEAYFVFWGRHLDYGYYDHGAVTGWLLAFMLQLGEATWVMRLPAVLISQAVGFIFWRLLRPIDPTKAAWAAGLYLVSPINLLNVLTTTDTPQLLFSILAVAFVVRGQRSGRDVDFLLVGVFIGLAILSKYLAALLIVLVLLGRGRQRLWMLLGIVPGVAVNLAWNYTHGWTNILFNLLTRNKTAGFSLEPPLLLMAVLLAFAGPAVVWALIRRRRADQQSWREQWAALPNGPAVFLFGFVVPIGLLLAISFLRKVGAHWVLAYYPLLYPALFARLTPEDLRRLIRPTALYSAVPVVLGFCIPFLPLSWIAGHKSAFNILLSLRPAEVLAVINEHREGHLLGTPSYSKSSLLAHFSDEPVPVVGLGSFHGRQDDFITDFRELDGRDILIVTDDLEDLEGSERWFAHAERVDPQLHGISFHILRGQGFRYDAYREAVLQPIAQKYYAMPPWLRQFTRGDGVFLEKYGFAPVWPPAR